MNFFYFFYFFAIYKVLIVNLYQMIVEFKNGNEILQIVLKVFRNTRLYLPKRIKTLLWFNSLFYELKFWQNLLKLVSVYLPAYMFINNQLDTGSLYSRVGKTRNIFKVARFLLKFQEEYLDFVKSLFKECLFNLSTYISDRCLFYLPIYFCKNYSKVKFTSKTYIFVLNSFSVLIKILKSKYQILLIKRSQFTENSILILLQKLIFKDNSFEFKSYNQFAIYYRGFYSFLNVLNV